jgi:MFS family permease
VIGTGALVAGFALAAMTIGWPISATLAGRVYMRIGMRDTALIGAFFVIVGAVLVAMLGREAEVWQAGGAAFVVGVGLGLSSSPTMIAVQTTVGWQQRGVATATNMFARSIGSAVGVAIFGAIVNGTLDGRETDRSALYESIHNVFLTMIVVAVLSVGALFLMPRRTPTQTDKAA